MLRVLEALMVRHNPPDSVTSYDRGEEQRDLFDSSAQGRVPLEVCCTLWRCSLSQLRGADVALVQDELIKLEKDLVAMEKNLEAIVVEQVSFVPPLRLPPNEIRIFEATCFTNCLVGQKEQTRYEPLGLWINRPSRNGSPCGVCSGAPRLYIVLGLLAVAVRLMCRFRSAIWSTSK